MLKPVLLAGAAAGSYALFPTLLWKAAHHARRLIAPPREERTLCLTFDDGPSAYTPALLDLLRRHQVPAAFFVVADRAAERPDLIDRMVREGHTVGCHSAAHVSPYLLGPAKTRADFDRAIGTMRQLGHPVRYYRPPWGVMSLPNLYELTARRLRPVLWDVMAQDWSGIPAAEIVRRLRARIAPGAVLCLHDGRGTDGAPGRTIEALSVLLPEWRAQGWRFARLEEVACHG